jgi:hypothetical protein
MVEAVFKLIIKTLLFSTIILVFAEPSIFLSYHLVTAYISFSDALIISRILDGDEITEAFQTVRDYTSLTIDVFISVILYSIITMIYSHLRSGEGSVKNWRQPLSTFVKSTLLRIVKIFSILFIFWSLFRFLPYEYVMDTKSSLSENRILALAVANMIMTGAIYKGWMFLWQRIST